MLKEPAGTKWCSACGAVKALDQFHRAAGKRLGVQSWCKACHNARMRRWREAHPAHRRGGGPAN